MKNTFQASKTVLALAVTGLISSGAFAAEKAEVITPSMSASTPTFEATDPTAEHSFIQSGLFDGGEGDDFAGALVTTAGLKFGDKASVSGATLSYQGNELRILGGTFSGFEVKKNNIGGSVFQHVGSVNDGDKMYLTVDGSTFTGNTGVRGGVGYVRNAKVFEVSNSIHSGNSSTGAAGVYDIHGSTTVISDSEFVGNKSATAGGALRIEGGSTKLDNVIFDKNEAGSINEKGQVTDSGLGGAIQLIGNDKLTLTGTDVVFSGNKTTNNGHGGALNIASADVSSEVSFTDSTFDGNFAGNGGAVYVQGQTISFTDTTFTNNQAQGFGGAIRANGGTINFNVSLGETNTVLGNTTVADSWTANRYAGDLGGFMYLQNGAKANFVVNGTLVIGQAGAASDGISAVSKAGKVNQINVSGDGKMVVNSDMTAFVGELNIDGGSLTLNSGIGEYDMAMQEAVNLASKGKDANYTSVGTKITLTKNAELTTGDLAVNNLLDIDVTNGTLKTGAITVDKSAEYKDLVINEKEEAAKSVTTTGAATLTSDGTAEIASITVNAERASFAADGTGSMTVLGDIAVEAGSFTSSTAEASAANISSKTANGFSVTDGDFVTGNVTAAKAGAVVIGSKSKLTANGTITGEKGGVSVAGTLVTGLANVVNYDAATGKATTLTNAVVDFNNGSLETTDEIDFTVDAWDSIKAAAGADHLKMGNGTLVASTPDGKLTFADVSKVEGYAGHAVVYKTAEKDGSVSVLPSNAMTIGKIVFEQAEGGQKVSKVTVGAKDKAHFVIRGTQTAGDQLIEGVDASTKIDDFVITNTCFGEKAGDQGMLGYDVTLNAVDVAEDTNFTFKTIKTAGNFTIRGTATVANFDAASTANTVKVDGGVLAMHGYVPGEQGVTETVRTFSTVEGTTLSNGALFAADDQLATAQQYKAMYDQYEADDVASGYKNKPEAVNMVYIAEKTYFTNALNFGKTTDSDFDVNKVYNVVAIDLAGVAASGFDATKDSIVTVDKGTFGTPDVDMFNLNKQVVTTIDGIDYVNVGTSLAGSTVDFGSVFYDNDLKIGGNGMAEVRVDEDEMNTLRLFGLNSYGSVDQQIRRYEGGNQIAQIIVNNYGDWTESVEEAFGQRVASSGLLKDGVTAQTFLDAFYDENVAVEDVRALMKDPSKYGDIVKMETDAMLGFVNSLREAEHAVTNMAALGGAFSTSFDINDQIRNTIDRRSSLANLNVVRSETGITPWVDVMGTFNSADGLYGSSGYEADIYGATLGADYTASCGAILGAAISIGQADANSVDHSSKIDNDVDFWGVSLYGSHRIGNVNGKFDIGYVSTSNDLSTSNAYFGRVKESLDADIFTIGLGAEYLANVGSLNVVPHAGIRWSSLDMDDSKYGADYDKMNLFQMPIGVTFSGTFDMTGWKVAPMFDISVVPAFGDKDAVASYTGGISESVRVVDTNPIQATLGVNASVGAWTFGVNYGLTAGSDERLNNSLNANARYSF